jgi:hypothetical protein
MPRLTIWDPDARWQYPDLRKDVQVPHPAADLETGDKSREPSPSQWNFSQPVALFEPFFSVAERSPGYHEILSDTLQQLRSVPATEDRRGDGSVLGDPVLLLDRQRPMIPGR